MRKNLPYTDISFIKQNVNFEIKRLGPRYDITVKNTSLTSWIRPRKYLQILIKFHSGKIKLRNLHIFSYLFSLTRLSDTIIK